MMAGEDQSVLLKYCWRDVAALLYLNYTHPDTARQLIQFGSEGCVGKGELETTSHGWSIC